MNFDEFWFRQSQTISEVSGSSPAFGAGTSAANMGMLNTHEGERNPSEKKYILYLL